MARLVRSSCQRQRKPALHQPDGALPLRWALIIVAATACGVAVGFAVGLVPGITVGLGVAGLLHKSLASS